jgi:Fur family ferric uptake transcriptional regulator
MADSRNPKKRTKTADGVKQQEPKFVATLRERGLRVTPQRRVVAEVLEEAEDHIDAETLFQRGRRRNPAIHRATVYRALRLFKRLGLVDELDLMHVSGEQHFYEIRPSLFHIHLVCVECGGVEEPGGVFWQQVRKRVEKESGFKPEGARLEMSGRCARCQGRGAKSAGPGTGSSGQRQAGDKGIPGSSRGAGS